MLKGVKRYSDFILFYAGSLNVNVSNSHQADISRVKLYILSLNIKYSSQINSEMQKKEKEKYANSLIPRNENNIKQKS